MQPYRFSNRARLREVLDEIDRENQEWAEVEDIDVDEAVAAVSEEEALRN